MRRQLAAALLVVLMVSSGCIGFLTGSNALSFDADDVRVSDAAQQDAGYEQSRDTTQEITRSFSAAGETRNVTVTNHVAEYQRSVGLPALGEQPFARFTVISSPAVEVAGQTFNPLGNLSNRDLAQQLQSEYDTVQNVQFVEDRTVTIRGESRTVSKFSAEATTEGGQSVDVFLQISKFRDGDDFIVVVSVYPQQLDGEEARADTMFSGVQHETGST